jgi:MerR family redox-sensitive transcriptional activator SoxR
LNDCLGCGCLSLTRCALYNPDDQAALDGSGSRWLREATEDDEGVADLEGSSAANG